MYQAELIQMNPKIEYKPQMFTDRQDLEQLQTEELTPKRRDFMAFFLSAFICVYLRLISLS